jgi:hypothetical protein
MKATITRNRCLYCHLVSMDVLVKGERVASLENGEAVELTLPDGGAEVRVAMGKWAGSAPLTITDGQTGVTLEAGAKLWPVFDILSLSYLSMLKDTVLYIRVKDQPPD